MRSTVQHGTGADALLLATCAVAESEALARVERRLREAAVAFLRLPVAGARDEARRCLHQLAIENRVDVSYLAIANPRRGRIEAVVSAGESGGPRFTMPELSALVGEAGDASRTGAVVEFPSTDGPALSGATTRELELRGIRALRWVTSPGPKGMLVVVGCHGRRTPTYWTERRRHLHDGMAEILFAMRPRLRLGRWLDPSHPASDPGS